MFLFILRIRINNSTTTCMKHQNNQLFIYIFSIIISKLYYVVKCRILTDVPYMYKFPRLWSAKLFRLKDGVVGAPLSFCVLPFVFLFIWCCLLSRYATFWPQWRSLCSSPPFCETIRWMYEGLSRCKRDLLGQREKCQGQQSMQQRTKGCSASQQQPWCRNLIIHINNVPVSQEKLAMC